MIYYVRQRLFCFAGGYALVAFYNTAQNELSGPDGHVVPSRLTVMPQQRSWLPWLSAAPKPARPVARPTDDLRYYVVEYDVHVALLLFALVLAGGWSSMAGAAAAVVLECNDDGPQKYHDLKRQYYEATSGNRASEQE